jgi:hypothetical protein
MPKEKFTAAFKAKVALEAIKEKETLAELAIGHIPPGEQEKAYAHVS